MKRLKKIKKLTMLIIFPQIFYEQCKEQSRAEQGVEQSKEQSRAEQEVEQGPYLLNDIT